MTDSPSEPRGDEATTGDGGSAPELDALSQWAEQLTATVGGSGWRSEHDTVRIAIDRDRWIEALRKARDDAGLEFFSWLSAVDWSAETAVGEPVSDGEALTERYEVIARLSSVTDARGAHFVAEISKDDAVIDSIVSEFGGAAWHEREAAEMFGIDFRGHPNLTKLYLPDAFEGFPLRKSYPLLSRDVKPWPGDVDVEDMPASEEPGEA